MEPNTINVPESRKNIQPQTKCDISRQDRYQGEQASQSNSHPNATNSNK